MEPTARRTRIGTRVWSALVVVLLTLSCTMPPPATGGSSTTGPLNMPNVAGEGSPAGWLDRINVMSVWPLDRDQQARFGIEVPGVFTWWDETNVRNLQRQGQIAVVNVEGLAAEQYLLRRHPELEAAITRDVFGNESRAGWYQSLQKVRNPVLVLSIESPVFQRYLLAQGRRAVDIGADALYIDEIQTSALLVGTEPYAAGFSPLEIGSYMDHLRALDFESPAAWLASRTDLPWLTEALAARLESPPIDRMSVTELLRSADPDLSIARLALLGHYRRFREDRAIAIMRSIIERTRDYAVARGHPLAIGANLAGMGDRTWWSPLMSVGWARTLDFVVSEQDVEVPGGSGFELSFPRGSFAPTYRLGRALTPGLVAAFPSVAFAPALHDLDRTGTYLAIMYAEAFASEGNWALGWWNEEMDWPRGELAPATLVPLTRFVRRWHRLYEGPRRANEVALLYSNQSVLAESQRHRSYVGLAQALGTLGVQYDVVYGGDARFGDTPLRSDDLARYRLVFAPAANDLTDRQIDGLEGAAAAGTRVVALAPVDPRLDATDIQVIDDVGQAFRAGDGAATLDVLEPIVGDVGRVRLGPGAEGILVTTYERDTLPGFVVHLVNERYRPLDDVVEPAVDVEVAVARPRSFEPGWTLWSLLPGRAPTEIPYEVDGDLLRFTFPRVDVYGVAVFTSELPRA